MSLPDYEDAAIERWREEKILRAFPEERRPREVPVRAPAGTDLAAEVLREASPAVRAIAERWVSS